MREQNKPNNNNFESILIKRKYFGMRKIEDCFFSYFDFPLFYDKSQTTEEWGNPVYPQSVRKKVPRRVSSRSLISQLLSDRTE